MSLSNAHPYRGHFSGDPEAIERIAYELCETQSKQGVLYFEVRFSPHFLSNTEPNDTWSSNGPYKGHGDLGPEQVLQCALRGFDRGGRDFGVKWGVILCCMCGYSGMRGPSRMSLWRVRISLRSYRMEQQYPGDVLKIQRPRRRRDRFGRKCEG